jgi:hypothetical protein
MLLTIQAIAVIIGLSTVISILIKLRNENN